MRRALLLLGLVLASVLPIAAQGERLTFSAKRLPLDRVIAALGRLAPLNVALDPRLSEVPITVEIKDASLDGAVREVAGAVKRLVPDSELTFKDRIYRLTLKPGGRVPKLPPPISDEPARKVTLALANVPLREAIALTYQLPGAEKKIEPPVEVDPNVPDLPINLNFSHDDERVVVKVLVRQAAVAVQGLGHVEKNGKLLVGVIPDFRAGSPEEFREFHAPPVADPERRLVLAFRRTPLKTVLSTVCRNALPRFGHAYDLEIPDNVPETPIDFTLVTDKPDRVLPALLTELKEQAPKVRVELSPGKLKVSAREPASYPVPKSLPKPEQLESPLITLPTEVLQQKTLEHGVRR